MSRFSKAEAERLGWKIVLEKPPHEVVINGTQGRVQRFPGRYEAEKSLTGENEGLTLHESDETLGKLLERIFAYETAQGKTVGEGDVITAEGRVSSEEFAARTRRDYIVTDEGMVEVDGTVDLNDTAAALARSKEESEKALEQIPTVQVTIESPTTDAPGASAGGTLLVGVDDPLVSAPLVGESEDEDEDVKDAKVDGVSVDELADAELASEGSKKS